MAAARGSAGVAVSAGARGPSRRLAERRTLDLAVVGAGPCGLAAAVAARKAGLRCTVFDRGCITDSLTHYPYYMTFFSTAELLEIGGVPFTIPNPKPTRREALAYYRRVAAHFRLDVRQYEEVVGIECPRIAPEGAGRGIEREGVGGGSAFLLRTRSRAGGERLTRARAAVIATGGFGEPNRLELEGGDPDGRVVHYYKDPFRYFDQDVVVVGGANSAVEAALDLHRNGVRVQLVHFGRKLDRGLKPWVRPDIGNRLASGEIRMHWRSRVRRVGGGERTATIVREDTGAATEVPCDWVLAMTGWQPDHAMLRSLGVEIDPVTGIPAHDGATMETNVPGIYIAGVIAAGFDANKIFIENGRDHGEAIVGAVGVARPGPEMRA